MTSGYTFRVISARYFKTDPLAYVLRVYGPDGALVLHQSPLFTSRRSARVAAEGIALCHANGWAA